MFEEERRRAVEERASGEVAASDNAHKVHLHEGTQNVVDGHAANALDLRLGNRLSIGDDGERLQGGAGKKCGLVLLEEGAHPASASGLGLEAVAAGDLLQGDAEAKPVEVLLDVEDGGHDVARKDVAVRGGSSSVVGRHFAQALADGVGPDRNGA